MNFTAWRYRRFHISYLLGWLAAGVLVGLVIGRDLPDGYHTYILFVGLTLVLGALRSGRWWSAVALTIAGACLGVLQASVTQAEYNRYGTYVGKGVEVTGTMTADAQKSGSGQRVTLGSVVIEGTQLPGEVYVTVIGNAELKRGDRLRVTGTLRQGFASYGGTMGAAKVGSVERPRDIIRDVRERFAISVRSVVTEPMASLGLGFVIGQRSTLPDTLDEQLKVVGLTHIVVASGYNLTILVRFVMRLLSRHSRYLALVGSLAMITGFVLFSGFSTSMNRAVIITVLGLLAWYVGRRFHPVLLILYVASVTALFNPMYIWSDLGWYLSFFAFAGILVLAPLVIRLVYRQREPIPFVQLVIETLCAEIMALPLVAFTFGTVPVFALVANVLVAPFIPLAMALTAITGLVGMVGTAFAGIIALPTSILIGYMIAVVEWLAAVPVAEVSLDVGFAPVIMWFMVVSGAIFYLKHRLHYDFRVRDKALEV